MGQKVNPIVFRLPVRRDWRSRWYATEKTFATSLISDYKVRDFIRKQWRGGMISKIEIERSGPKARVKIFTPRPGIIIGVKGKELDILTAKLKKIAGADVVIDVQEVKKPDLEAQLIAENIAVQLERRIPFRRALKKSAQSAMSFGAHGIRVKCSGRLGGAEIARTEHQGAGSVPRQTIRANVDYGFTEANTTAGKIGVMCWLNKPDEVSSEKKQQRRLSQERGNRE